MTVTPEERLAAMQRQLDDLDDRRPALGYIPESGMACRQHAGDGRWYVLDYVTAEPMHPADAAAVVPYAPATGPAWLHHVRTFLAAHPELRAALATEAARLLGVTPAPPTR